MAKNEASKGNRSNGSVFDNYTNRLAEGSGVCNWSTADPGLLTRLIYLATSRGGAVRFGYSRDGGAYALGLYYGSEVATKYCRPQEDINDFLTRWCGFFDNLPESGGKSPDQG